MPKYSQTSLDRLRACDERLQILFGEVILHVDVSILCGHRTEEEQEEAFRTGHSNLRWPQSKHNSLPSLAVDIAPWPIDWSDELRFWTTGAFVMGIASQMGIGLRWGGLWDRPWEHVSSPGFRDIGHFELID